MHTCIDLGILEVLCVIGLMLLSVFLIGVPQASFVIYRLRTSAGVDVCAECPFQNLYLMTGDVVFDLGAFWLDNPLESEVLGVKTSSIFGRGIDRLGSELLARDCELSLSKLRVCMSHGSELYRRTFGSLTVLSVSKKSSVFPFSLIVLKLLEVFMDISSLSDVFSPSTSSGNSRTPMKFFHGILLFPLVVLVGVLKLPALLLICFECMSFSVSRVKLSELNSSSDLLNSVLDGKVNSFSA